MSSDDSGPAIGEEDYDNGGRNEYAERYQQQHKHHLPSLSPSPEAAGEAAKQQSDDSGRSRTTSDDTEATPDADRRQPYDDSTQYQEGDEYQHVNTLPGRQGYDYPAYDKVPLTGFYCYDQKYPGYYADVEAGCQVFHVCDVDGRQDSFLCPRGTVFSQALFVCDWWFNVDCPRAAEHYGLNARLHQVASSSDYSRGGSDAVSQQGDEHEKQNHESTNHIDDVAAANYEN